MKKRIPTLLKIFLSLLFGIMGLACTLALILWFKPQWVLTSERASKFLSPLKITLKVTKPAINEWFFDIELAPGCYTVPDRFASPIFFCVQRGHLAFTMRFHRPTLLQLTALNHVDFQITTLDIKSGPESPPTTISTPTGPPAWTRYIADRFTWGPFHLGVDEMRIADGDILLHARISNFGPTPTLDFAADAKSKGFKVSAHGKIEQRNSRIEIPEAKAVYEELNPGPDVKPMHITSELTGSYDFEHALLQLEFSARWKNPLSQLAFIAAEGGRFRMDRTGMWASSRLKVALHGKTPLGGLPLMTLNVSAELRRTESEESPPIDVKLDLASYDFAGIRAVSDLEIRILPKENRTDLELRRGDLRIEVPEFKKTVTALARTSWSIPAPFAVLQGPITFHALPFKNGENIVEIPFVLNTDLKSAEQAIQLETRATLDLSPKDLTPVGIKLAILLKKIRLRIPDYDPIAPVPALRRDPRIVRYSEKEVLIVQKKVPALPPTTFPIEVTIDGPPGSVSLLNRFLIPSIELQPKVKFAGKTGVMTGEIGLSNEVDIEYLNRRIKLESMLLTFTPSAAFSAVVSMRRGGYRITANIKQAQGKTRILLAAEPPLNEDEIISLIIYGMPRNSITAEQTRSVGNAQTAITSEAIGVFSFLAFASTPIESIIYDPATQTYSAIIRLPGGIVASIGSNWETENQVSLSKALGRNWAVSTELIKDSEGVDRGGTLLRWRKSY